MKRKWWKEGIVYQIYPRSFNDSNNDGIGDIKGIIEKIDYIADLGVDIVWLNPVYKSPNDDNGYDISDYQDIMDEFGTLQDWEDLLKILHERNIKLIMDLVVNHTSDEHQWFIESRSSKKNKYRDYYIWRPKKDDKEPNNWTAVFGGSVWEYDQSTEEYYLHLFTKKQPDLNWDNPEVRNNIYKMMEWWLDKGIDGFRMDVINMISKSPELPDEIIDPEKGKRAGLDVFTHGPKVHDYLKEMNDKVLSRYDIMTVGECPATNIEQGIKYVDENRNELDMIFHFEHVDLDYSEKGERWHVGNVDLIEFKKIYTNWHHVLHNKGWNSIYFMNHDQPRTVSRYGNDSLQYRNISAKMLATFLLTMPGTPYIYMGDEIGMTNVAFDSIKDYRDIETLNYYKMATNNGEPIEKVMKNIHFRSRDNSRTPIQWDSSQNAGFSNVTPWIKVNPNYTEINVEASQKDPDSILTYYKDLIKLRKDNLVLIYGDYELIDKPNDSIYAYRRFDNDQEIIVMLNFSLKNADLNLDKNFNKDNINLLASNYNVEKANLTEKLTLEPYEARIYKILK